MNPKINSRYDFKIWQEIDELHLSPSHDRWHIDRVIEFAHKLHSIYGGEWEVISAAAIMHDLGRTNPDKHGEESIDESVYQAIPILDNINFPAEKKEKVILAIKEHDQPTLKPSTIEGRILKDADFLAGFGAWGVLRIALWAGETGGGMDQIMHRLEHKMLKRLENLEFPESEYWANKETLFSKLFLSSLKSDSNFQTILPKGKYILLEGISCSGKDTQAKMLSTKLLQQGYNVLIVKEPSGDYKDIRSNIKRKNRRCLDDPTTKMFILSADRHRLVQEQIIPALNNGEIVISVRSYLSTLVYQCKKGIDADLVAFLHKFVPLPDLVILYDIDAETSRHRIEKRPRERKDYEEFEKLNKQRKRYLDLIQSPIIGKTIITIDGSLKDDDIAKQTYDAVTSTLKKNIR